MIFVFMVDFSAAGGKTQPTVLTTDSCQLETAKSFLALMLGWRIFRKETILLRPP